MNNVVLEISDRGYNTLKNNIETYFNKRIKMNKSHSKRVKMYFIFL